MKELTKLGYIFGTNGAFTRYILDLMGTNRIKIIVTKDNSANNWNCILICYVYGQDGYALVHEMTLNHNCTYEWIADLTKSIQEPVYLTKQIETK